MELKDPSLHLKLIEMCDCYLETDYQSALLRAASAHSTELQEDALTYLAVAILATITEKAESLSLKKKEGTISVKIKSDEGKKQLAPPPEPIFHEINRCLRSILHIDAEKGESPLILGLRNGQLDLKVKVKRDKEEDKESIKITLPKL